jgi:hypothetical protein
LAAPPRTPSRDYSTHSLYAGGASQGRRRGFSQEMRMNKSARRRPRYQHLELSQLLLAYFFAGWHVRRMPRATPEDSKRRAIWVRDHGTTFTERWYALGVTAWFVQISPLGVLAAPADVPALAIFALVAMAIGTHHLLWQILAQEKAGLPPIEEPVPIRELRKPPKRRR